jgi:predicted transglutaminase-like cysteine proteinase
MRPPLCGRENARIQSKVVFGLAACIIAIGAIGAPAQAQTLAALPFPSTAFGTDGTAKPTAGWLKFCERLPDECTVDLSEPTVVQLTIPGWQTLVRVNRQVNAAITPMTDQEHWGSDDRWDFAEDGYGDCEDYQLVKRRRLVEAGFPRRVLRMTVVINNEGRGHAVLMIRTDRGDFVLENKRDVLLPWEQTGYVYIKREGSDGLAWTSLGSATAPVATAGL